MLIAREPQVVARFSSTAVTKKACAKRLILLSRISTKPSAPFFATRISESTCILRWPLSRLEGMTARLLDLPVKVFADGADLQGIAELARQPYIHGLTTNPTLMRKVGLTDYERFAKAVLKEVNSKPISFEVFSDDFAEMHRQALKMHEWQDNVYVKIPVTNTSGESSVPLIQRLADEGVKVNITAMLTPRQVTAVTAVLNPGIPSILSVFAGRIADTGVDPSPIMKESLTIVRTLPNAELLWASVREVLNVFQAAACGCHIVTVPHDILKKLLELGGKDLDELSLDTVRMFHRDAVAAGFKL